MTILQEVYEPEHKNFLGVGELGSPRWKWAADTSQPVDHASTDANNGADTFDALEIFMERDNAGSGSPWTIEAIDGELEEQDFVHLSPSPHYNAAVEESGGEEILYPRQTMSAKLVQNIQLRAASANDLKSKIAYHGQSDSSYQEVQSPSIDEITSEGPIGIQEGKRYFALVAREILTIWN